MEALPYLLDDRLLRHHILLDKLGALDNLHATLHVREMSSPLCGSVGTAFPPPIFTTQRGTRRRRALCGSQISANPCPPGRKCPVIETDDQGEEVRARGCVGSQAMLCRGSPLGRALPEGGGAGEHLLDDPLVGNLDGPVNGSVDEPLLGDDTLLRLEEVVSYVGTCSSPFSTESRKSREPPCMHIGGRKSTLKHASRPA